MSRKKRNQWVALRPGESVVFTEHPSWILNIPKYVLTLGLYSMWRRRKSFVVTNDRLLLGKGLVNRTERSIPMTRVDDAGYVRRGMASYTEVVVRGHESEGVLRLGPLSSRKARRFASELQGHMSS